MTLGGFKLLSCQREVFQIVTATDAACDFYPAMNGRQSQRSQNRDDPDHNQHFDECKAFTVPLTAMVKCTAHGRASPRLNRLFRVAAPAGRMPAQNAVIVL